MKSMKFICEQLLFRRKATLVYSFATFFFFSHCIFRSLVVRTPKWALVKSYQFTIVYCHCFLFARLPFTNAPNNRMFIRYSLQTTLECWTLYNLIIDSTHFTYTILASYTALFCARKKRLNGICGFHISLHTHTHTLAHLWHSALYLAGPYAVASNMRHLISYFGVDFLENSHLNVERRWFGNYSVMLKWKTYRDIHSFVVVLFNY